MLNRFATLAAVCTLVPVATAPLALADPPPPPVVPVADAAPPPDNGLVPSGPPGVAHTSDGRTLTVVAKDETQLPVPPLTTSLVVARLAGGRHLHRDRNGLGEGRHA